MDRGHLNAEILTCLSFKALVLIPVYKKCFLSWECCFRLIIWVECAAEFRYMTSLFCPWIYIWMLKHLQPDLTGIRITTRWLIRMKKCLLEKSNIEAPALTLPLNLTCVRCTNEIIQISKNV